MHLGEASIVIGSPAGFGEAGFGGLESLGGAPSIVPAPLYFGFDVAEHVELNGTGAYVLDAFSGVHAAQGTSR